jgi:hypothetical protein
MKANFGLENTESFIPFNPLMLRSLNAKFIFWSEGVNKLW